MFGKITKKDVTHHFNKAKAFVGHHYGVAKNILNDIDKGVTTFKHIYSALTPLLDKYGVINKVHPHAMKALSGYDTIKNKVLEFNNDLNNIKI